MLSLLGARIRLEFLFNRGIRVVGKKFFHLSPGFLDSIQLSVCGG